MNSSSTKICRQKLENVIERYPNATEYWAYIINKDYKSEDRIWKYQQKENEKIRRISGDKLYEMVTGDPEAIKKVFEAIPEAIIDLLGENYKLNSNNQKIMNEFKNYIFDKSD